MTPPLTVTDLVQDYIDRTGDSYGTIAKKTGLSKQLIGLIVNADKPRAYRADTLEALARGLHLPLDVLKRAASASAGFTSTSAGTEDASGTRDDDRIIIELLHRLTDAEAEVVRVMVQALSDRRDR